MLFLSQRLGPARGSRHPERPTQGGTTPSGGGEAPRNRAQGAARDQREEARTLGQGGVSPQPREQACGPRLSDGILRSWLVQSEACPPHIKNQYTGRLSSPLSTRYHYILMIFNLPLVYLCSFPQSNWIGFFTLVIYLSGFEYNRFHLRTMISSPIAI